MPFTEYRSRHPVEEWAPTGFGDRATEEAYRRRVSTLLGNFWSGEVSSLGEAIYEELEFNLVIDDPNGGPPVVVSGSIDRIDRLPSGGVEVITRPGGSAHRRAWTRASSCRSTRWPVATPQISVPRRR